MGAFGGSKAEQEGGNRKFPDKGLTWAGVRGEACLAVGGLKMCVHFRYWEGNVKPFINEIYIYVS